MRNDTVIQVSSVSKKYCRSLKHTMMYGLADLSRNFLGLSSRGDCLRSGEFWAVDDISFEVKRGECIGLIGPNGSGKSTLLKMLNGIFMPDRGEIRVNGRVGALIEVGAGFHPMLTGRENVYVGGAILGMSKKEVDKKFNAIIDFADIGDFIDAPVKHYSSGMYVRLGFSVAVHLRPDILLIDEVLAVGDTAFRLKCFNYMTQLVDQGKTIILVSHNFSEISRVCTKTIVLDRSRMVFEGSLAKAFLVYEEMMLAQHRKLSSKSSAFTITGMTPQGKIFEDCSSFHQGEDVEFEINYDSKFSTEDCIVLIKVSSVETGHFSSFTNRVNGQKIPIQKGSGSIRFKIYSPPLLGGNYSVEVHFYSCDSSEFWDQLVPACSFKVTEPMPDVWREYHKIRLFHEWLD